MKTWAEYSAWQKAKQQMSGIEAEEILLRPTSVNIGTLDDAGIIFEKKFIDAFLKLPEGNAFRRFATALAKSRHKEKATDALAAEEALSFLNHHLLTGNRPDIPCKPYHIKLAPDEMAALEIFMREREQHPTRRRFLQVGAAAGILGGFGLNMAFKGRREEILEPIEYPGDDSDERKKLEWAANEAKRYGQLHKRLGEISSEINYAAVASGIFIISSVMLVLANCLKINDSPETVLDKAASLFEAAARDYRSSPAQSR